MLRRRARSMVRGTLSSPPRCPGRPASTVRNGTTPMQSRFYKRSIAILAWLPARAADPSPGLLMCTRAEEEGRIASWYEVDFGTSDGDGDGGGNGGGNGD
jgi:hypothetical protein